MSALLLFAFIPALISCSSPDEDGVECEKPSVFPLEAPIGFSCRDGVSRAVSLETIYDNFCIHAFKVNTDGTKSLVIPDYIVKHIDGEWTYSGLTRADGAIQYLKYWDLSADSYTFAAVTPSSSTGSSYSIDGDGKFSITLADLQTDWMIARTVRRGVNDTSTLLDYDDIAENVDDIDMSAAKTSAVFAAPNYPYAEVPLNFHRILAKVIIKAYAEGEITLTPLEVGLNNIGVAPATYSYDSGWTTTLQDYQQLYNQNTVITSEQNTPQTAQLLAELYVIPQQLTDATNSSLVQIRAKMNDNQAYNLDIPNLWEPNKVYIYYLRFEGGETGEVILFDVEVQPFTKGNEAEDEQTNW